MRRGIPFSWERPQVDRLPARRDDRGRRRRWDDGGAALGSPRDLPGLALWLKADSITGLSNTDPVATWTDSGPAGLTATQGTGSKQPTWLASSLNSRPGVSFDGVDDVLGLSATILTVPFTVLAVYSMSGGGVSRGLLTAATTWTGPGLAVGGVNQFGWGSADSSVRYQSSGWTDNAARYRTFYAGALYDNGAAVTPSASANTPITGAGWPLQHIGVAAAIILYELIAYTRALATLERVPVEAYLAARYAL